MYEGLNILCIRCGRFVHNTSAYTFHATSRSTSSLPSFSLHPTNSCTSPDTLSSTSEPTWHTVSFPSKPRSSKGKTSPINRHQTHQHTQAHGMLTSSNDNAATSPTMEDLHILAGNSSNPNLPTKVISTPRFFNSTNLSLLISDDVYLKQLS